ncbi:hypothetical protein CCUS01_11470 [Colletotrichum cuscutae]|uniref:Uncharacterized protein n=1 Tax=Colletotrichum cuscutae TaxID=1209917 RepID=A0AAI9U4E7_9PEZI|nr:hypothetical protein CCUS01_11470 [Colletotrichum cuscutae]
MYPVPVTRTPQDFAGQRNRASTTRTPQGIAAEEMRSHIAVRRYRHTQIVAMFWL